MSGDKIIGVIPARYASSRLPGKPLVDIHGKTMIQWVYENASRAALPDRIIVATDDDRIVEAVESFGGQALMTPESLASGTDRVAHVSGLFQADIWINIQGDEPFIEPEEVDQVAKILTDDLDAVMGTLVKRITDVDELLNPNTAKVVVDEKMNALYFSRSPIPYFRDENNPVQWISSHCYFKQVGIYSFRDSFLKKITEWDVSSLEKTEKLEQLRILEKGYRIKLAETEYDPVCIDTQEDLERVRKMVIQKTV